MCANVPGGGGVGSQCGYGANVHLVKKIFFELDFFLKLKIENEKRNFEKPKKEKNKIWIEDLLLVFCVCFSVYCFYCLCLLVCKISYNRF